MKLYPINAIEHRKSYIMFMEWIGVPVSWNANFDISKL